MGRSRSVLLLGGGDPRIFDLSRRLRGMHYRAICAKTAEEALRIVEDPRHAVEVALVPPALPDAILPEALHTLRARSASERLALIAVGRRPEGDVIERLRSGGIELALFEPVSDQALRFQVNRAMAAPPPAHRRHSPRVPTDWHPGFRQGERRREAAVYSLSAEGAFLSTPRPCMRGAHVAVELPLPLSHLDVDARVLYTNVTGNLRRANLPTGMGILFSDLGEEDARVLRAFVEELTGRYEL